MTPSTVAAGPLPLLRPPRPTTGSRSWPADRTSPGEPVPVAWVQGTLALDLDGVPDGADGSGLAGAPELSLVPDGGAGPQHELEVWAARFAQAALEVLGGDRPVSQLLRWTNARVYQELERRVRILARTGPAPLRRRTVRPQVRSVHVFQPGPTVAEVSVHVRHGQRSRALAARLEEHDARWRCVALQLG